MKRTLGVGVVLALGALVGVGPASADTWTVSDHTSAVVARSPVPWTTVRPAVFWHVRSGDTLSRVAAHTGVSVSRLVDANRIPDRNLIYVGQVLRIPG